MSGGGGVAPNVLVTGTPGVGKSTFSEQLATRLGMKHLDVAKMVREERLYLEWDDDMKCSIFDEDMVIEALQPKLDEGGCVVDFHSVDFLPVDKFVIVVVLSTDNTVLFDRLTARGYDQKKIEENVQCEIFQISLDAAKETFGEEGGKIVELVNDEYSQLAGHVDTVASLLSGAK